MSELSAIEFIVQAGAVGISILLIWYVNQQAKRHKEEAENYSKVIENHLAHSSNVMDEVAKSNIKVAKALQKMSDVCQAFIKNNKNSKTFEKN